MPGALPNRKNKVKLPPAKAAKAQGAIKNFLPSIPWPPTNAAASTQLAAAVAPFLAEINKAQVAAAKKASPTGVGSAAAPAVQLAAQETNIGTSVPGIAKCLPVGTDLNDTSFASAISTMQDAVAALEEMARNPTALGAQSGRDASLSKYFKSK